MSALPRTPHTDHPASAARFPRAVESGPAQELALPARLAVSWPLSRFVGARLLGIAPEPGAEFEIALAVDGARASASIVARHARGGATEKPLWSVPAASIVFERDEERGVIGVDVAGRASLTLGAEAEPDGGAAYRLLYARLRGCGAMIPGGTHGAPALDKAE